MKKNMALVIVLILIVASVLIVVINKNSQKYIMRDGIMLALTLNGKKISTYPEGTNYYVDVNCTNGFGKWLAEEWKLAVEEVTGNVVCNIDFTSNPKTLINEVEEVNVNNNYNGHGYRYSGYNPDNYIWFNDEIWRIIGSIPTCLSASCGTNTSNLVKIIRNDSIGSIAYDAKATGYTGAWGSNTLYSLLNTHYYSSTVSGLNGQSHSGCRGWCGSDTLTKAKCDYTGIGILSTSYYGKMIKNVYWNTGASVDSVTASTSYTNEISKRTISGYIGLMSASDYGYATDSSYHNITFSSIPSNHEMILNNWLFEEGWLWTNTQFSKDTTYSLGVYPHGGFVWSSPMNYAVKPVLYLDSSVYIVSGDGTEGNPYQIGM